MLNVDGSKVAGDDPGNPPPLRAPEPKLLTYESFNNNQDQSCVQRNHKKIDFISEINKISLLQTLTIDIYARWKRKQQF